MLTTWKKYQTIPFIDIGTAPTVDWARIGKSTIFDLAFNANIETFDFIEDANPTDIIKNYAPTLPQELRTVAGDPAFDAMYDMMYALPTGDAAVKDVLLVFPKEASSGVFQAWKVPATVVLKDFNTVDEKIIFDLNFGGTITKGTVVITNGKPVFTATSDASLKVLTVTSAAGTATGSTKITVSPALSGANTYAYAMSSVQQVLPSVGADLSAWAVWGGSADIVAIAGFYIVVVEVDASGKCVGAGQATIVVK